MGYWLIVPGGSALGYGETKTERTEKTEKTEKTERQVGTN
jgi:hypothetical protein